MSARLLVISGPLRNSEFSLGPVVSIGRDPDNAIYLDDSAVSPHHCTIALQDGKLILSDLDSYSGTFVNGLPVKQRELKAGDELAIGSSVFHFEAEKLQGPPHNPVQVSEQRVLTGTALELRPEDLYLDPGQLAALPRPDRTARNLNSLIYICQGVGSLRDEESLPWQLLSMIFDIIPAERGAILLTEEGSTEIRSQVAWDRSHGPEHPVHVSSEVARRALHEGISLLEGADGAVTRTSLCVPLLSRAELNRGKPVGLIYLESSNPAAGLTRDDFQLLTAIASLGVIAIENARKFDQLDSENQRLRAEVNLTHDMVGRSARMRGIYQFIERVAPTDSTVLIHGESGTGKELIAAAVHKNSTRKNQPFVALNCAALTETLLESELFGHEKGAFTSAVNLKKGFLEVAEGGTIFLDEIGELSLILQAKLLRVLQEREFVRVGGTKPIKINVRFVAATNKDLQKCVREEKFRADLYHRLNVISIAVPSLRDRSEDIPVLAEYFAARHAKNCNRRVSGISTQAMTCLTHYDWPGNVRELENALERAVVIGSSDKILPEDLPEAITENGKPETAASARYHDAILNLKKQLILAAFDQSNGNVTEAAKHLGVHVNYLHRLVRNLELRPAMKKYAGE